jgi:hypothetical protein
LFYTEVHLGYSHAVICVGGINRSSSGIFQNCVILPLAIP